MKVVLIKNNENLLLEEINISGYKFSPRRENISSLKIVNNEIVKNVINKKINKIIAKLDKTIQLIISSDVTIIEDCNMMENEIQKVINLINNKYLIYISELDFFEYIKKIYVLNMSLNLKKRMVGNL